MERVLIFKKIIEVMRAIEAIDKSRKNSQQGYSFRGIDDIYNELHAHLAEAGVFTVPKVIEERTEERTTSKGSALIYRVLKIEYSFYAEDGSSVAAVVIGEGMDSGDKASNKAMSVAHKYAFLQVFAIATEDNKDPENESHSVAPQKPAARAFTAKNPDAVKWLEKILTQKNIDKTHWKKIFQLAEGHHPEQILNEVLNWSRSDV